ncbi:MAG: heterocyst frequency control protein PatD [Leptolyngbya sp. Prado105]|jgi:hypothetical protein|nr:heterocyst frequency control protein PatD [Leptolyngbya sp. Prado105]
MLTENQVYLFRSFQIDLGSFNQLLDSAAFDRQIFDQSWRSLQKKFAEEIQPMQSDDYRIHSVLVEINKQMRLLGMDSLFLKTARQSETMQGRVGQIRDRIALLMNYCAVLLESDES